MILYDSIWFYRILYDSIDILGNNLHCISLVHIGALDGVPDRKVPGRRTSQRSECLITNTSEIFQRLPPPQKHSLAEASAAPQ